ncbi:sirohydrochlorin chelatase [Halobacillus aidingensis]|uniref:Sirohydrochlorin ferrochelatase n=2 Tax=Halobacillus TaxID=45667 RepID=A0A1H0UU57_HALAD|nr:sirohydrochlorin chelatase [Halobacillus aidingensis]SDP69714.1 sirohydrochlorin ferrochelatase [Halobacillus aidingensis]
MEAVLYVSHGSRKKEAKDEAIHFLTRVHKEIDVDLYHICFLELADPDVLEGIRKLVEKGADKIAVIPVLLLSAGHYFKDIPNEIEKAKAIYPNLSITYGQTLGVQERITDVLVDRLKELPAELDDTTNVLLVGRGSRHPDTKTSIEYIARVLKEKSGIQHIQTCYLAALSPRFTDAFDESLRKYAKTIVVPYLWFTGLLYDSLESSVQKARGEGHHVDLASYLNDHPNMVQSLVDRVNQALNKGVEKEEGVK